MNLHRLDLVSLALFARVARTGSISQGAALAHLAVGAASKRITELEATVGVALFERHSRGVTLTAAGQALNRHVLRLLSDIDQLAADLSDHADGIAGVVRLYANTSAITQFLPADLAAFAAAQPGVRIELHEHNSDSVVRAVLDGRAELGIFAEGTVAAGLQVRLYRRDRLVLVVPRGHPLARRRSMPFAGAADLEFVSLAQATSLAQRMASATRDLGRALRVRIHVRSFDAMCQMVAAGLGVAVLPDAAVRPHLRSMGLSKIDLQDRWADRELLIGARDLGALPRPARLLLEHLLPRA